MFSGSEILVTKSQITVREVDGDGILYDENTGTLHLFNGSSLFIWNLLDGSMNLEDIAKKLASHFSIEESRARDDVFEFANKLEELKLVDVLNEKKGY